MISYKYLSVTFHALASKHMGVERCRHHS